jgi:hypothetical protein
MCDINTLNKYSIAILVPVCSRNQNYKIIEDIPFYKYLLPSFLKTYNLEYKYTFYLGIDTTDEFYMKHHTKINSNYNNISIRYILLEDCEHKPARAWNRLFEAAYNYHDYFYQIGDDIVMLNPWINRFIEVLSAQDNIGIVGPCNDINYSGRRALNKPAVIENGFVHKTHFNIFGTFFNKEIDNWYCDDWITEVYKPNYSTHCVDIKVENKIYDRYKVKPIDDRIERLIEEGKKKLHRYFI